QLPVHPLLPDRQSGLVDDAGGARDAHPRGREHAEISRQRRHRPRANQLQRTPTARDRPDRQEGPLMTQIIEISTQYQLANVAALIRSGRLGGDGNLGEAGRLGDDRQRRILVVANNSFAPELTPAADAMPGSRGCWPISISSSIGMPRSGRTIRRPSASPASAPPSWNAPCGGSGASTITNRSNSSSSPCPATLPGR